MEEKNVSTIGEYLINERTDRGFSLVNISQYTRINISVLEKLESNDFSKLPNLTYLKGFVKAYVKAINANEAFALSLLETNYRSFHQKEKESSESPILKSEPIKPNYGPAIFITVSLITLLIIGGYLTIYQFKKGKSSNNEMELAAKKMEESIGETIPNDQAVTTSPEILSVDTNQENVAPAVTPTPAPTLAATATPTPKSTPTPEATKAPMPTPTPKATPTATPTPKPTPQASKDTQTSSPPLQNEIKALMDGEEINFSINSGVKYTYVNKIENLDELIPVSFQKAMRPKKQNIYINAFEGDSWITYKKDSDPVKKFVLKKGRYLFIVGDDIRLFVGNVQASRIFSNNKLIEIDSKHGVKSLIFPESNWNKYHIPLFVFPKDGPAISSDEYLRSR